MVVTPYKHEMSVKMTTSLEALGCSLLLSPKDGLSFKGVYRLLSFLIVIQVGVHSHPQCLDSGPPFKPPLYIWSFAPCMKTGCCDQDKDNVIAERYWSVMDNYDYKEQELWRDYVKNILCQVSSSEHRRFGQFAHWITILGAKELRCSISLG